MKIVVGLGNPGKEYASTPHNAGFLVVDELAGMVSCGLRRNSRFQARIGQVPRGDDKLTLVQPQTFMNNSGAAVAAILGFWKISPADMVVVLDDADLKMGQLRIRQRGSSGGHRGLESVIQSVGTAEFVRVRVGIGRDRQGGDLVGHVLAPFEGAAAAWMVRIVRQAAEAVMCVFDAGGEDAMNRFNGVTVEQTEGNDSNAERAS